MIANALQDAARLDARAEELASRSQSLSAELGELSRDVRLYREGLAADPHRLQEIRERAAALKALQRKYGATDAEVLEFLAEASTRLQSLATADERVAELTADVERLGSGMRELAAILTRAARRSAPELGAALERELHELGMPGATVAGRARARGRAGSGRGRTRGAPVVRRPRAEGAPLAKTASGGELSRTMLACRSVLADLDDVPTLVFDEVDAGIGGEAGLAVGRRLARLAGGRQVLVVDAHLPRSPASPIGTSWSRSRRHGDGSEPVRRGARAASSRGCSPVSPAARGRSRMRGTAGGSVRLAGDDQLSSRMLEAVQGCAFTVRVGYPPMGPGEAIPDRPSTRSYARPESGRMRARMQEGALTRLPRRLEGRTGGRLDAVEWRPASRASTGERRISSRGRNPATLR